MPVNLSIKNVPDKIAERLRRRAARNHRSLQGELMAMLECATSDGDAAGNEFGDEHRGYRAEERLTASQVLTRARERGIRTEGKSVVDMIREDRDRDGVPPHREALEIVRRIRDEGICAPGTREAECQGDQRTHSQTWSDVEG